MEKAVLWLVALMHLWVPRGYDADLYTRRDARETAEQTDARFQQIAQAVAAVAYDPEERPLFGGSHGRAGTAALLLSIAFHESSFLRNVDYGIGKLGRGDLGQSWCMMQLHLGRKKVRLASGEAIEDSAAPTAEGWTGRELVADREKCFRAGLHMVRRSWGCGTLADKLTVYASGTCVTERNEESVAGGKRIRLASAARVMRAVRYFSQHKPDFDDSEIMVPRESPPAGGVAAASVP